LVTMRRRAAPAPNMNKRGTDYASAGRGVSEEAAFWHCEMLLGERARGEVGMPPANPGDPECVEAHAEGLAAGVKSVSPPRLDDGVVQPAEHHSKRQPRGSAVKFRPVNPEPSPDPKKRGSQLKLSEAMKIARERRRDEREL
jgi:hypothetical protein